MQRTGGIGTQTFSNQQKKIYSNLESTEEPKPAGKKNYGDENKKNTPSPLTVIGTVDTLYHPLSHEILQAAEAEMKRQQIEKGGTGTPQVWCPPERYQGREYPGRRRPATPCIKLQQQENGSLSPPDYAKEQVALRVAHLEHHLRTQDEELFRSEKELALLKHMKRSMEASKILAMPPNCRTPSQSKFARQLAAAQEEARRNPLLEGKRIVDLRCLPKPSGAATPTLNLNESLATVENPGIRKGGKRAAPNSKEPREAPYSLNATHEPPLVRKLVRQRVPEASDALNTFVTREFRQLRQSKTNGSLDKSKHFEICPESKQLKEIEERISQHKEKLERRYQAGRKIQLPESSLEVPKGQDASAPAAE